MVAKMIGWITETSTKKSDIVRFLRWNLHPAQKRRAAWVMLI
jgi:hypothetical protein